MQNSSIYSTLDKIYDDTKETNKHVSKRDEYNKDSDFVSSLNDKNTNTCYFII